MPVKAIPKISVGRNGVGAYIVPCHKITLQYCNWGGSSAGIREYLKAGNLNNLASKKPYIYFNIIKKQGHPRLEFHYNNKSTKEVDINNLSSKEIEERINEYSQASGNKLSKFNQRVLSINESVRGIWSPLHSRKEFRHKI